MLALTNGVSESVTFPAALRQGQGAPPADVPLEEIGSNDWVVSGRHSATGKPLLANDPHRTLMLPSLRYTVHLNAPGWNVIGAGEPALPGVAAGHNDRVAFGFTIVGMDQQDLYVERLDPADHGPLPLPRRVRADAGRARDDSRSGARRRARWSCGSPGTARCCTWTRPAAAPTRCAGSARSPEAPATSESLALDTVRDWNGVPRGGVGLEGAVREPGLRGRGREHRLDRGGPRAGPTRLERPAAGARARRDATSGAASCRWPTCRSRSTRRAASSPPPTTTSCRPATRGRSGSSSARRSASGGSSTCSATARQPDGGSPSPTSSGCSTTSARSCRRRRRRAADRGCRGRRRSVGRRRR